MLRQSVKHMALKSVTTTTNPQKWVTICYLATTHGSKQTNLGFRRGSVQFPHLQGQFFSNAANQSLSSATRPGLPYSYLADWLLSYLSNFLPRWPDRQWAQLISKNNMQKSYLCSHQSKQNWKRTMQLSYIFLFFSKYPPIDLYHTKSHYIQAKPN